MPNVVATWKFLMFLHRIKDVWINGVVLRIVLQENNGPCALIALVNVLILSRRFVLPAGLNLVSIDSLAELLGSFILDSSRSGNMLRTEVNDYLALLIDSISSLSQGLNVNIGFFSPSSFEHSSELLLFDILSVRLYHAWVVSSDDFDAYPYVSKRSYNDVVNRVIQYNDLLCRNTQSVNDTSTVQTREGDDQDTEDKELAAAVDQDTQCMEEGEVLKRWLEDHPRQVTTEGLIQLVSLVEEGDYFVLFMNEHFSAATKRNGSLYCLVTAEAFIDYVDLVWEKIDVVDQGERAGGGGGDFFDGNFNETRRSLHIHEQTETSHYSNSQLVHTNKNDCCSLS